MSGSDEARHPVPEVVDEPGQPAYVRIDPAPMIGAAGLLVRVCVEPASPVLASPAPQVALAHAEDAEGWSLGIDEAGRPSLVVGTRSGPAAVRLAEPLRPGGRYEFAARIPGPTSDRLVLAVSGDGIAGELSGWVRLAGPVLNARGPLLWGCRSLRGGVRPEFPFTGRVSDVAIVADAAAEGSRNALASDPRRAVRWLSAARTGPG